MIYPQSLANSEPMMQMPQRWREGGGNCHAIHGCNIHLTMLHELTCHPLERVLHYTPCTCPRQQCCCVGFATLLAASNGNSSSSSCYWGTLSLAMAMATMAMEAYNVHNALKRAKNFRFSEHNILRFHGSLPHAGKWKIHCHIHTHTPYPDTHTLASESDILVCSFFGKSFEALGRQR